MARLPELFSDDHVDGGPARSPRRLDVAAGPDELPAELDAIVHVDDLADLRAVGDAELEALTERLVAFERLVSDRFSVFAGGWSTDGQALAILRQPPTDLKRDRRVLRAGQACSDDHGGSERATSPHLA